MERGLGICDIKTDNTRGERYSGNGSQGNMRRNGGRGKQSKQNMYENVIRKLAILYAN